MRRQLERGLNRGAGDALVQPDVIFGLSRANRRRSFRPEDAINWPRIEASRSEEEVLCRVRVSIDACVGEGLR